MTDGPSQLFISELVDVLRRAKAAYDSTADAHEKRRAWATQLGALISLAYQYDDDCFDLVAPLRDLQVAFMSLDAGAVEPPLQPQKVSSRPRSVGAAMFRGYAAAASDALIRGGIPASVADAIVSERLDGLGYRKEPIMGNGTITATTIRGHLPWPLIREELFIETMRGPNAPTMVDISHPTARIYEEFHKTGLNL